ncbi:MAG: hypothetical protein ABI377_06840 [Devosia sp.]
MSEGSDDMNAERPARASGARRASAVAVLGVVFSGIIAGSILVGQPGARAGNGGAEMTVVATADLAAAQPTIAPEGRDALVGAARSCRAPLGVVSLSTTDAGTSGYVRIHSGSYVSPYFPVTNLPQRVAVPFPAPYATGRGVIVVEGSASDVLLSLTPTLFYAKQAGQKQISVWWPTDKPCGGG